MYMYSTCHFMRALTSVGCLCTSGHTLIGVYLIEGRGVGGGE